MARKTQWSTPADASVGEQLHDVGVVLGVVVMGFGSYILWAALFATVLLGATGSVTETESLLLNPPALGLGMLTGTIFYLAVTDRELTFVDLSVPSGRDLLYTAGGLLVLLGIAMAAEIVMHYFGVEAAEHSTTQLLETADPIVALYMVVASLLFIGPGEELLFRNVVQKRLYESFSGVGAVLVASVVFAAVHFQAYLTGSPAQMVTSLAVVFLLSLLLGAVYLQTQNLFVPAFVHGAYNAVVFYLNVGQGGFLA